MQQYIQDFLDLIKKHDINGIIFDMDDTIMDSAGAWQFVRECMFGENPEYGGFPAILENMGFRSDKTFADFLHKYSHTDLSSLTAGLSLAAGAAVYWRLLTVFFDFPEEALDESVIDFAAKHIADIRLGFAKEYYAKHVEWIPGADELLKALKGVNTEAQQLKIKMALATAAHPEILSDMASKPVGKEGLSLHSFFPRGWMFSTGDDWIGKDKPNPYIFEYAAGSMQLTDPTRILVLEDSKYGVLAAMRAGYKVVIVPSRENIAEILNSLAAEEGFNPELIIGVMPYEVFTDRAEQVREQLNLR